MLLKEVLEHMGLTTIFDSCFKINEIISAFEQLKTVINATSTNSDNISLYLCGDYNQNVNLMIPEEVLSQEVELAKLPLLIKEKVISSKINALEIAITSLKAQTSDDIFTKEVHALQNAKMFKERNLEYLLNDRLLSHDVKEDTLMTAMRNVKTDVAKKELITKLHTHQTTVLFEMMEQGRKLSLRLNQEWDMKLEQLQHQFAMKKAQLIHLEKMLQEWKLKNI